MLFALRIRNRILIFLEVSLVFYCRFRHYEFLQLFLLLIFLLIICWKFICGGDLSQAMFIIVFVISFCSCLAFVFVFSFISLYSVGGMFWLCKI